VQHRAIKTRCSRHLQHGPVHEVHRPVLGLPQAPCSRVRGIPHKRPPGQNPALEALSREARTRRTCIFVDAAWPCKNTLCVPRGNKKAMGLSSVLLSHLPRPPPGRYLRGFGVRGAPRRIGHFAHDMARCATHPESPQIAARGEGPDTTRRQAHGIISHNEGFCVKGVSLHGHENLERAAIVETLMPQIWVPGTEQD
jgi:hypothetical protein